MIITDILFFKIVLAPSHTDPWTSLLICRHPVLNLCHRPPNFFICFKVRMTIYLQGSVRNHYTHVNVNTMLLCKRDISHPSVLRVVSRVLEEEAKVKVKVGCAVTVNVGCWLGGEDDRSSSASKFSDPLFVVSNVDWSRSLSVVGHTPFSKWDRTDSASPTFVAVLRPSSSSEKSSVIYEGHILCEKCIILYIDLAHFSINSWVPPEVASARASLDKTNLVLKFCICRS